MRADGTHRLEHVRATRGAIGSGSYPSRSAIAPEQRPRRGFARCCWSAGRLLGGGERTGRTVIAHRARSGMSGASGARRAAFVRSRAAPRSPASHCTSRMQVHIRLGRELAGGRARQASALPRLFRFERRLVPSGRGEPSMGLPVRGTVGSVGAISASFDCCGRFAGRRKLRPWPPCERPPSRCLSAG
jgi:hypothetical protein